MENIIITFTSQQISPATRQTSSQNIRFCIQNKGGAKSSHLISWGKDFVFHLKNLQDLAAHLDVGELKNTVLRVVRMTLAVSDISPMCQSTGMIGDLIRQQSVTLWSTSLRGAASRWERCFRYSVTVLFQAEICIDVNGYFWPLINKNIWPSVFSLFSLSLYFTFSWQIGLSAVTGLLFWGDITRFSSMPNIPLIFFIFYPILVLCKLVLAFPELIKILFK